MTRIAALDVVELRKTYANGVEALKGVSLRVEPGDLVSLLGPSGCGKSTLLRLAAGLETPTVGTIMADGVQITQPDPSRVVMFQDPMLYPWRTVKANISLGPEARGLLRRQGHRVDEALRLVGLTPFAMAYPHQLSGGMAQRAALARALVNDPRLLLLDEPLGKLDSLTRLAMQEELVAIWRRTGLTALLVTHDVEEALFLGTRVVVMSSRPGRVLRDVRADLPRPRDFSVLRHPQFVDMKAELFALVREQTIAAAADSSGRTGGAGVA